MRNELTFLEVLWLLCFYWNLDNFSWWLVAGLVLAFPRWRHFIDAVKVENHAREKRKEAATIEKKIKNEQKKQNN